MSGGLFEQIRSNCAEVTRRAKSVRIDEEGLAKFAGELAAAEWPTHDLDPLHDFEGDDQAKLSLTITLDAINFGSGWFPELRKTDGMSGYRTIASAVKKHYETEGILTGEQLRKTTPRSVAEMLGQDLSDSDVADLMTLYTLAWRDLGIWLLEMHEDQFDGVVRAAEGSAESLVQSLAQMPLYRDVAQYGDFEVPFYKRAQITVADLHAAFGDGPFGHFDDLSDLTLFADNLVPHVLRCYGVVVYDAPLAARVDSGQRLEPGTPEEVEIRAVAVEAVERLVSALGDRGRATTAHALDGLLWNAGQSPEVKARPRHRTRCTFY
ncbi:MAG: queuosine salvage family protein [Myxococcota bacterium]